MLRPQANFHWEKTFTQTETHQTTSAWLTSSTDSTSNTTTKSHEVQDSGDSHWDLAVSVGSTFGISPVDINGGTTVLGTIGLDKNSGGSTSQSTTNGGSSEANQAFEMTKENSNEVQNTLETSVSETYSWCAVVCPFNPNPLRGALKEVTFAGDRSLQGPEDCSGRRRQGRGVHHVGVRNGFVAPISMNRALQVSEKPVCVCREGTIDKLDWVGNLTMVGTPQSQCRQRRSVAARPFRDPLPHPPNPNNPPRAVL